MVCGENLIRLLTSGADQWNAFRSLNPGCVMLNRVSLPEASLSDADLHRAFLLGSDFHRANLARACLEGAILRNTNFHESDLRFAKIDGADLFAADLSGADLRYASLASAFLRRADLRGADLSGVQGLTANQIAGAVGDQDTKLPEDLPRPASWDERRAS